MSKSVKHFQSIFCKLCESQNKLLQKSWINNSSDIGFYRRYSSVCSLKVGTFRRKQPIEKWRILGYIGSFRTIITTSGADTIIKSPHNNVTLPNTSFTEFVFGTLDQNKNNVVMVDNPTGRSFTAAQLKDASIRVASGLVKLGFKKGDRILIFANNCPEYGILFLACGAIGATVTTANPVYTAGELARQLNHSHAVAVVTMPHLHSVVVQAVESDQEVSQNVKLVISIGDMEGCFPFKKLMEDDGKAFPENVTIDPDNDLMVLPYSSGTTGLPKGVELTHTNIIANLLQLTRGPMSLNPETERLIGVLPFYHIYGMVVVQFGSVCLGTKLVIIPRFEPEVFLSIIQQHKLSYLHLVPPLALFLAKSPLVDNFDISSVHSIICGAAPLGEGLTKEVNNRINAEVIQAYGLTECSPVTNYDRIPVKHGTIGQLVPNTEAKMIDLSTGESLKPGETGELLVRGPQVMKGYLKNQQATDDMIKDGWLHTGDIGHVDEDGYIIISDRVKELIKYKGFQIAPAELEALIYTHPAVQDVAVIGIPKGEEFGEVPRAFVVPKPDTKLQEDDVTKFVEENVAPYKKLRGGVQFVESIPKTASGKILRRELKKML